MLFSKRMKLYSDLKFGVHVGHALWSDVWQWTASNRLRLNPSNTEVVWCAQSCPCIGLTHGLGWVDIFLVFGGLGWIGSTLAKVLKIWKDYVNALIAQLDKIWLHQAVKLLVVLGWVQIFPLVVGWVGSISWRVGLDRVTQNGPVDNSGCASALHG